MSRRVPAYIVVAVVCALLGALFQWPARPGASAQTSCQPFQATGKVVCGRFLQYWERNGGLAQQGYPISNEFTEVSEVDGKSYTVQYFERAVFELHPENKPPHDVLLSLLGNQYYKQKYPNGAGGQTPNTTTGSVAFKETGHRLGGIFLQYWRAHGGLPQQGYPISDEFNEVSDLDGKTYKVQYFERAVFEYHPDEKPQFQVLLSQLGTFQLKRKYAAGEPTPGPKPTAAAGGEPPRISLQEFKALYDDPAKRPIILDVRTLSAYRQGHIKGAISFPEADVDKRAGELPKDKLIVAYCQ